MEKELQDERASLKDLKEENTLRAETEISDLERRLSEKMKSEEYLQSEIEKLKKDLFNMRFKKINGQLQNNKPTFHGTKGVWQMHLDIDSNFKINQSYNSSIRHY